MSDSDQTRSGAGGVGSSASGNSAEIDALVAALLGGLAGRSSNQLDLSDGIDRSEILNVIRIISGRKNLLPEEDTDDPNNPMTPVNSLFGNGPISRFLNGKKTAIGIFGLLGTYVLPIMFPGAAPILAALKGLGLDQVAQDPESGTKILTGLFSAFAAWGGLGKLEKWTKRLERFRL